MIWTPLPRQHPLAPHAVHLVHLATDETGAADASLLSAAERRRADRLEHPADRQCFVASHVALRTLLGRWLGVDAGAVALAVSRTGKPCVAARPDVQFSLSHAGDHAVIALAIGRAVGVDIEELRLRPELPALVETYFTASERRALEPVGGMAWLEAVYATWTRKEAFLKAEGTGMSRALGDVEVSTAPLDEARLLSVVGVPDAAARWAMLSDSPAPDTVVSLCAAAPLGPVERWELPR